MPILHRYGVKTEEYQKGYHTAHSIEVRRTLPHFLLASGQGSFLSFLLIFGLFFSFPDRGQAHRGCLRRWRGDLQ